MEWQQEIKLLQQYNKNMETGLEDQRNEVYRQKEITESQRQEVERLSEDLESIKKKEVIYTDGSKLHGCAYSLTQ